MKRVIIFVLAIFAINCHFLREMAAVTVKSAALETDCFNQGSTSKVTLNLTVSADFAASTATFKLSDTATIALTCDATTVAVSNKTKCEKTLTGEETVGKYTLEKIVETGEGGQTHTITDITAAFTIADTIALGNQTTPQEVDTEDDSKNTFTIVFAEAVTAGPAVYANATATTAIANCTLATDKKSISCKPSSTEMDDGKEYKIHYMNGCVKTDTNITVKFTDSSSFVTISKIAVVILALLF
jgi:hypothetical protein